MVVGENMRLKCPKCKYVWNYTGKGFYATCPRCYKKVDVKKYRTTEKLTNPKTAIDIQEVKRAIDVIMKYYNMIKEETAEEKANSENESIYYKLDFIFGTLNELFKKRGTAIPKEDLLEECRKRGLDITEKEFEELLDRLKRTCEIYEPKFEEYLPSHIPA